MGDGFTIEICSVMLGVFRDLYAWSSRIRRSGSQSLEQQSNAEKVDSYQNTTGPLRWPRFIPESIFEEDYRRRSFGHNSLFEPQRDEELKHKLGCLVHLCG
jgi:hypothetical protein